MFGFLLNPSQYFIKNLMASLSISYVNGMCYLRTKSFHVRYSWQFMLLRMKWNTECIIPFDLVQQKKKQLHYYLRYEILLAVYASTYIRNVLFHSILFRRRKNNYTIIFDVKYCWQFMLVRIYGMYYFIRSCSGYWRNSKKFRFWCILHTNSYIN